MRSRVSAWSVPLLIVAASSACDNVAWGGADVQIVPPPPPQSALEIEPDARVFAEFGLPTGPLIFHLTDTERGSQLIPIAELSGASIRAIRRPPDVSQQAFESRFRETVIPIGSQFDVFSRGARVGTFVAQSEGPPTPCGIPTAIGPTTVVAAAVEEPEYLAFRSGLAPPARGEFSPLQITGPIRTYASIVAERLILQAGLPRPRSWPGAQRHLAPLQIVDGGHPEMASTYLVGDALAVGQPQSEGYSVFYIADYETARGYMPIYSEVRDYRSTGKAAPRLVDYVNWTEQEAPEIVVQVYGREQSWYQVISNSSGEWTKIWEGEPCATEGGSG
ncbi:MAG: hypothetical protein GEU90_05085 [Gemmatimonas sp.]|nr:hypothetical protein [Gemmatimonas sp.]